MLALLALPLALAQSPEAPQTAPDRVRLKSGKTHEGTLLLAGADEYVLLDAKGELREFPARSVRQAAGPRAEYAEFRARLAQAYSDRSSADEAFEFAGWCRARGYARDEQLALWRALALDEMHEGAHRALGHEPQGEIWMTPLGEGRTASWPELLRLRASPAAPWTFTTMHFDVVVSGPLDRAVIAAAAAEHFYGEIYSLFQRRAEMWDLRRPIEVRIWPGKQLGYPRGDPRLDGHWDRGARVLHTWLESREGAPARPVSYERLLAEAILRCASEELTSSLPELPPWLVAGAGILLAEAVQWGSGLPVVDARQPSQTWVDRHAAVALPRTAAALAVAAEEEFVGPRGEGAQAQAYTLLHSLLLGDGPGFPAEFDEFLRRAVRNRGGGSAFRECFGRRLDELERSWSERVLRLARPSPGARG